MWISVKVTRLYFFRNNLRSFVASPAGLSVTSSRVARSTAGRHRLRRSLLELIFRQRCLFTALLPVCRCKIHVLPPLL